MQRKRDEWYIPNSTNLEPLGPFTFDQVISMIEAKELKMDSYIWNMEFVTHRWVRLYELKDFESHLQVYPKCKFPKRMSGGTSTLKKVNINYDQEHGQLAEENEYRRYPRAPLKVYSVVHNQKIYAKGIIEDISEKGVYLHLGELDVFEVGEEINLTLLDCPILGTVNIKSVIINARITNGQQGYGIYFLHLSPFLRRKIATYVVKTLGGVKKNNRAVDKEAS